MQGSFDARPATKTALDPALQSLRTPTVNDGRPQRGRGREEPADADSAWLSRSVSEQRTNPWTFRTTQEEPADEPGRSGGCFPYLGAILSRLAILPKLKLLFQTGIPVEVKLAILCHHVLSPCDRAVCCRLSKILLPVARKALYRSLTFEVHNYCVEDEYVLIDRYSKALFNLLPKRHDLAGLVNDIRVKVHNTGSYPNLDYDPAELEAVEEANESSDIDWEQEDVMTEGARALDVQDFKYSAHLQKVLQTTTNLSTLHVDGAVNHSYHNHLFRQIRLPFLTRLDLPDFPLSLVTRFPSLSHLTVGNPSIGNKAVTSGSSTLRHLAIRDLRVLHAAPLGPSLSDFPSLESFAFQYDAREPANSWTPEQHVHPDLSAYTSLHTISLRVWAQSCDETAETRRPRFPPTIRTLVLRAGESFNGRWRNSSCAAKRLLSKPFLAILPPSVFHLHIDPAPFDINSLCAFLSSPNNLPSLETVTILQSVEAPDPYSSDDSDEEEDATPPPQTDAEQAAQQEIRRACKERGVLVRIEGEE